MTSGFLVNLLLALTWIAITGHFSLVNLGFGFLLGASVLYLIRGQVGTIGYFLRTQKVISLALLFLYALLLSTLRVAKIVLQPRIKLQPGIIAYPLSVQRPFQITLLANLITLTPGTLSIDVSKDQKTLYIHCIDVPDPGALIKDIHDGFERKILEVYQ